MNIKNKNTVEEILTSARLASRDLANLDANTRNKVLGLMATTIDERKEELLKANAKDLTKARVLLNEGKITEAMVSRLKLTDSKISDIINGINDVAKLSDPIGATLKATELDEGLELYQETAPIGVLAVIFESRPDALPQIASLAFKTANAVLLKGGSEAEHSLSVLFECLQHALASCNISAHAINLISTREDVREILKADGLVDLIIPRGSNALVRHIQDNTRIPVLGHADGICHLYVHEDANIEMAVKLAIDSKTQYPSACNAVETLIIHKSVLPSYLPLVAKTLIEKNVELRLDNTAYDYLFNSEATPSNFIRAIENDWSQEYCDLILSIKTVDSLFEAINHINKYGSGHTDCIVTESKNSFDKFFKSIDSAGVYWNASTRFADGYRYGFGAEVGIATGKLHPRGPVGLDGLVTYKYKLEGSGQTVEDYSGPDSKQFSHKDISN